MKRKIPLLLLLGFLSGSWVFADTIDTVLDGDALNNIIRTYADNAASLIPDSATIQNVWSFAPGLRNHGWFAIGLNGSFTMLEQKTVSQILNGGNSFGGSNMDITQIPKSLPFIPAGSFDIRGGTKRFDVGITGMYIESSWLPALKGLLGEDSDYKYGTGGVDVRFAIFRDGKLFKYMPAITLQAGYYFTWMNFGFASEGNTEKININLRNDSYMAALQISKEDLLIFNPYVGFKAIISKTDTDFSWNTDRPVMVDGGEYPVGMTYNAAGVAGDPKLYLHLYGGLGITFGFEHLLTVGASYNVITNHFGVNLAVRILFVGKS